jgi:CrcB protein
MIWLLVALVGGGGASIRFVSDTWISRRLGRHIPYGTMTVNVIGSFLGGVILGFSRWGSTHLELAAVLLTGLMGGLTTASTLAAEFAGMVDQKRYREAIVLPIVLALVAVVLALCGLGIGLAL